MGPPDLILNVGSMNFLGHSYLLSSFSEVLKAACKDYRPVENGMKKVIQLTNISPDFINYILYYIYTGQLNLNEDNVLGILLVCHLLRIPKIVQICNDYLLRNQSHSFDKSYTYNPPNIDNKDVSINVIRPIANKPKPVNTAFEGPITSHVWLPSSDTTFKPPKVREKLTNTAVYLPIITANVKPKIDEELDSSQKSNENLKRGRMNNGETTCQTKTIIDIANCDGPVRFKKILNTAYNASKLMKISPNTKIDNPINIAKKESGIEITFIRDSIKNLNTQNFNQSNKCIYCNQVFKSKYCFQKHKMRHINNVDVVKNVNLNKQVQKQNNTKKLRHYKRDVKPLDMNVQYYPCKTCGVKFPSYYFVHKHRKLCHSDEEN